jgi:hypothetical protein
MRDADRCDSGTSDHAGRSDLVYRSSRETRAGFRP